jgi:FHA domain-containing protein
MHLLIRAVSLAGQPLTQAISAYFDERGGTIGRSDTNTLALPDPERRISRLQAEVSRGAEGWRILNVGNANPIWHNNRPVPPGEGILLDEGDELQIGTYALMVNYSQNDETARTITKGRATIDSRTVIAGSGQEPKTDSGRMQAEGRAAVASASSASAVSSAAAAPFSAPSVPLSSFGAVSTPVSAPALAQVPTSAFSSASASSASPAAASPFADLLGDLSAGSASSTPPGAGPAPSSASPFADILGFGGHAAPAPFASLGGGGASAAPAVATAASRLPDDFDPFADLAPASPSGRAAASASSWDLPKPAPAASSSSSSPFDFGSPSSRTSPSQQSSPLPGDLDLLGSVQPAGSQSIDHLFGLSGKAAAPSHDPLADFLKKTEPTAPAGAAVGAPSSIDPLALLQSRDTISDAPPPAQQPTATQSDHVSELNAAMVLPQVPARPAFRSDEPPTVDFKTPLRPPATQESASPFGDLGLGVASAGSGLLDHLDLKPQVVHDTVDAFTEEEEDTRPGDLDFAFDMHAKAAALNAPPIDTPLPPPLPLASDPPAVAPASPEMSADGAALWTGFCEGAGVKFMPPQGLNPDLMRVIGQVLRNAVDGSLKLVAARAATKTELRAEVTVIQARRNNPLKFSPDTQSALEQLLQPPMRGFMSGPDSVADAMDDLLGHTIGTMVGMRAALEGVLSRFEPAQLETKLVGHSMLDSLLPMNRRAKLWELYLQHYETVRTEAQDDFHNLFGRAFLQAYEEQLDRLDAERRETGRAPGSTA